MPANGADCGPVGKELENAPAGSQSGLRKFSQLPVTAAGIDPALVLAVLAERGLTRVLIEGGGCTVGRFLEAGLLDRLQLAVSPLILGGGRPALPVSPARRLEEALRPPSRCHIMGEDVLFDLALRPGMPAVAGG